MYVIESREVRRIPVGVLWAFPSFLVTRFSKISIASHEAIWFGKTQHDKTNQNRLFTFINRLNYQMNGYV